MVSLGKCKRRRAAASCERLGLGIPLRDLHSPRAVVPDASKSRSPGAAPEASVRCWGVRSWRVRVTDGAHQGVCRGEGGRANERADLLWDEMS